LRLANAEKAAGFANAYQQRYCAEFEGFGYVFRYGLMRWGLVGDPFPDADYAGMIGKVTGGFDTVGGEH
jgi:hypothetical protein